MPVELGVFVFRGRHTAKQVLGEVREGGFAWIEDVAVVERNTRGRLSVHSTWAQNEDDRKGLGLGALTGALVGVLMGPAGVVVGAAVGATGGGLVGSGIDIAQYDPRLEDVAKALEPDTSALMLWAQPTDVEAFVAAFRAHGAKLIRSSLSDKQARKLRAALRVEP
ncbi:MAG TPA: DUF1269 domain-containing protein [Thermomicrobiales bacterium]|jgi:uncharacterized membrane protein